ncbi:hypothetical protein QTG56_25820 (plasmid) [Rossellomorea sp. AcN35-11]|nr:hypothetical protein [Rossellomorea aquimaris]WJV32035.1 hypothetical protein QTG56_25820 [Rossellomorea sp. AcN35-11]
MYKINTVSRVDVEAATNPYKVNVTVSFQDGRFRRRIINICKKDAVVLQVNPSLIGLIFKKKSRVNVQIFSNRNSFTSHYEDPLEKIFEDKGVFGFNYKKEADDFKVEIELRLSKFIDRMIRDYEALLAEADKEKFESV